MLLLGAVAEALTQMGSKILYWALFLIMPIFLIWIAGSFLPIHKRARNVLLKVVSAGWAIYAVWQISEVFK
jgi:hypothetical protein